MIIKKTLAVLFLATGLILPQVSLADDTVIFGGEAVNLAPNILIVFDNSGSMGDYIDVQVTQQPYDPTITYSNQGYDPHYVYYDYNNHGYWVDWIYIGSDHEVDSNEIVCEAVRNALNTGGVYGPVQLCESGRSTCQYYPCGSCSSYGNACRNGTTVNRTLATGNYLNWLNQPDTVSRRKIDIAKDTIWEVIKTTPGVRWGIMVFNSPAYNSDNSQGGHVEIPVKDRGRGSYVNSWPYPNEPDSTTCSNGNADCNYTRNQMITELKNVIYAQSASTWTPLAETLAEAGLYYAGAAPHFGTNSAAGAMNGSVYRTPIDYRCRSNNVIIITDGQPTTDRDPFIISQNYLFGETIGDADQDGRNELYGYSTSNSDTYYGSDYLDDVAYYLYHKDLIRSGNDASGNPFGNYDPNNPERILLQNVVTYTIGFNIHTDLLQRTADDGQGVGAGLGSYFTTEATGGQGVNLATAIRRIVGEIQERNANYVTPVVPVSRSNRTYADNAVYMAFFSPSDKTPGFWRGNLKKYGLDSNAMLLDRTGIPATDTTTGRILDSSHSYWWYNGNAEGVDVTVGGVGNRLLDGNITRRFYTNRAGGIISFSNTTISATDLGLLLDTERDDLINYLTASGVYSPTSTDARYKRSWVLGDILHSRPAVLYDYDRNVNALFAGSNDGFLHCFVDTPGSAGWPNTDTVTEKWAYTPYDLLTNLKTIPSLKTTMLITGDNEHDIFVDGSPIVYKAANNSNYVAFGLRRGGSKYYSLRLTANDENYTPIWAWDSDNYISSLGEPMGQSWSTPLFCKIKTTSTDTTGQEVLLLAGGYDTNQDLGTPAALDTSGRAIYAVQAQTGLLTTANLRFTYANTNSIRNCIVDLISYDGNDDGFEDVIYAGTLGGDLFAFTDKENNGSGGYGDGTWSSSLIFHAASDDGTTTKNKKFFYSPGIAQESWGDWVFIGSGNREDPLDDLPEGVRSNDYIYAVKNTWSGTTIQDSDLYDVTSDLLQDGTTQQKQDVTAQLASNTYKGWKILLENAGEKVTSSPLVYNKVVYFTTFEPSIAQNTDPCTSAGSGTARLYALDYSNGNAAFGAHKANRSILLGGGMPSQPIVIVTQADSSGPGGTFVGVTMEGGWLAPQAGGIRNIHKYYWRLQ